MFDPNDYPRTQRQADEEDRREAERAWEREHECHRRDCAAACDETKACDGCGDHFCDLHLYDGFCMACFAIAEANEAQLAAEMPERKAA